MVEIKFEGNKSRAYDGNEKVGECEFIESEDLWNIVHTKVIESYQGQGIARKLVECVVENANNCGKHIIADCSYAKKIIENKKGELR